MKFVTDDYKRKLKKIKSYYKSDKNFLECYFDNYNEFHIYFRIDYIKASKSYLLRWFDLDYVKTSGIWRYESCEFIEDGIVERIKELNEDISYNEEILGEDSNVYLDIKSKKKCSYNFYKYIPDTDNGQLREIFDILFSSLPKKLNAFYEEIIGLNSNMIEYERRFRFDLFKDDLVELFDDVIINRGEDYYRENKVIFLEKIDDRYFSVVSGNELYLVIIKYDELSHDMQVYCSCPCEFFCKHIYAVIKAIREKKFNPFYKVMLKKKYEDMFEEVMSFNYSLSIGASDDVLGVIGDDGKIEWVPILDKEKNSKWVIIEDDKKNRLAKAIINLMSK